MYARGSEAMVKPSKPKHTQPLPNARSIRRSCEKELYRALKKLKAYVPKEKLKQAENQYFKKVVQHLTWIHEHKNNRKLQLDWWEKNCSLELAQILDINHEKFIEAFRDAYGG